MANNSFDSSTGDLFGESREENQKHSGDASPDLDSDPEPDWEQVKEEAEKEHEADYVQDLEEQNERLRAALLRGGYDLDDVLGADVRDEPDLDRLAWHSDPEPLSGCEHLPDTTFSDLPAPLDEAVSFFDAVHRRDVFLMAALGRISAVLPNVIGYWGSDMPEALGPNLYNAIVAGASGGKGVATFAKALTQPVHKAIREKSDRKRKQWKKEKREVEEAGDTFDGPQPPEQYLNVPMNTSAAKLIEMLVANDERGLLTTSEIDTLTDTLRQDWGKISPLLRGGYHHESSGQARKTDGVQHLDAPHISLVMVGTDRQFARLIQSPEDGLFSRITLYYFDSAVSYRSQRPTREGIERRDRLEGMGRRILDLWQMLQGRPEALQFKPEEQHWQAIEQHFDQLHYDVQSHGFGDLISIPRRAGLWSFRIAMTLATLRAHAEGAPLRTLDTLTPSDADVSAALNIASTCADHSLRFARGKLNAFEPASAKDSRIASMLAAVGDSFSSGEAYAAAKAAGIDASRRTLRRDLNAAAERGLINSTGNRGGWRKTR